MHWKGKHSYVNLSFFFPQTTNFGTDNLLKMFCHKRKLRSLAWANPYLQPKEGQAGQTNAFSVRAGMSQDEKQLNDFQKTVCRGSTRSFRIDFLETVTKWKKGSPNPIINKILDSLPVFTPETIISVRESLVVTINRRHEVSSGDGQEVSSHGRGALSCGSFFKTPHWPEGDHNFAIKT